MTEQVPDKKILVARDLRKLYSGASQPAVKGFGISITEGEIFGLLGPNGAGKDNNDLHDEHAHETHEREY